MMQLDQWASTLSDMLRKLNPTELVRAEVPLFADELAAASPKRSGNLRRSWLARKMEVLSTAVYALMVDRGGRIVARRRASLVIPFGGYRIGSVGYVTVADRFGKGSSIVSTATGQVAGVRRRSVRIRSRKYLERGREAFVAKSERAMAGKLERMAPRG